MEIYDHPTFRMAAQQFDLVADYLHIPEAERGRLKFPKRSMTVARFPERWNHGMGQIDGVTLRWVSLCPLFLFPLIPKFRHPVRSLFGDLRFEFLGTLLGSRCVFGSSSFDAIGTDPFARHRGGAGRRRLRPEMSRIDR